MAIPVLHRTEQQLRTSEFCLSPAFMPTWQIEDAFVPWHSKINVSWDLFSKLFCQSSPNCGILGSNRTSVMWVPGCPDMCRLICTKVSSRKKKCSRVIRAVGKWEALSIHKIQRTKYKNKRSTTNCLITCPLAHQNLKTWEFPSKSVPSLTLGKLNFLSLSRGCVCSRASTTSKCV